MALAVQMKYHYNKVQESPFNFNGNTSICPYYVRTHECLIQSNSIHSLSLGSIGHHLHEKTEISTSYLPVNIGTKPPLTTNISLEHHHYTVNLLL